MLEAMEYGYDWFVSHNYQIEEAVYNQFEGNIWKSDTRNLVDEKFNYAMSNISYLMLQGDIEVKKAIDVFGKDAFSESGINVQYDPLTGRQMVYHQNDYYFFATNDSAKDKIHDYEVTIRRGVGL